MYLSFYGWKIWDEFRCWLAYSLHCNTCPHSTPKTQATPKVIEWNKIFDLKQKNIKKIFLESQRPLVFDGKSKLNCDLYELNDSHAKPTKVTTTPPFAGVYGPT